MAASAGVTRPLVCDPVPLGVVKTCHPWTGPQSLALKTKEQSSIHDRDESLSQATQLSALQGILALFPSVLALTCCIARKSMTDCKVIKNQAFFMAIAIMSRERP